MATIVGVFDNDTDLERALNQLHQAGFEDDVRVIDPAQQAQPNISDETLLGGIGAVNSSVGSGTAAPLPYAVPAFQNATDPLASGDTLGLLSGYDLTIDEADYYAHRVQKGSKLIIVRTEEEHRDFVWEIMRRSHAQQWTGKDAR